MHRKNNNILNKSFKPAPTCRTKEYLKFGQNCKKIAESEQKLKKEGKNMKKIIILFVAVMSLSSCIHSSKCKCGSGEAHTHQHSEADCADCKKEEKK
jgi:hypothetical protein